MFAAAPRLTVQLARNLRRMTMRGHPWIYREALASPSSAGRAQLCQVLDGKREPLAWAIYDPHGPLALRVLSLDRSPPTSILIEARMARALALRAGLRRDGGTNCFRLFNGEGDLLPGLVCDVYADVAVVQFDGEGPGEFWDRNRVAAWLVAIAGCARVVEKLRRAESKNLVSLAGPAVSEPVAVLENGAAFQVDIENGQKTGFFLDQRDNRSYVRGVARGKSCLNLFSYTGGFSVYAGLGGAAKVTSVDIAKSALALADENWRANGLAPAAHESRCGDVFASLADERERWDMILVDPPSLCRSEEQKASAQAKYIELFSAAARKVRSGGDLFLSSCSSHISFEDFFAIVDEALSSARRRGQVLRVSGQGADHPFPHACRELRYLKFAHLRLD